MIQNLCYCLLGLVVGVGISCLVAWLVWRLLRRFKNQQWYDVCSFSKEPTKDGVYHVEFYLKDFGHSPHVVRGYTKKLPASGIEPKDLKVKIRHYHIGRGLYRVFWELKQEKC